MIDASRDRTSNIDEDPFFSHLVYFCSLSDALPAIGVKCEKGAVFLKSRPEYLQIAELLDKQWITAVIDPSSSHDCVEQIRKRNGVTIVDWDKIDELERKYPYSATWQVLFFDRELQMQEQERFATQITGFFTSLAQGYPQAEKSNFLLDAVLFTNAAACFYQLSQRFQRLKADEPPLRNVPHPEKLGVATFKITAPVGDERWFGAYLAQIVQFSAQYVKVISFQGRKFTF